MKKKKEVNEGPHEGGTKKAGSQQDYPKRDLREKNQSIRGRLPPISGLKREFEKKKDEVDGSARKWAQRFTMQYLSTFRNTELGEVKGKNGKSNSKDRGFKEKILTEGLMVRAEGETARTACRSPLDGVEKIYKKRRAVLSNKAGGPKAEI